MLQYLQVGNKTVSVGGDGGEARVCMERWVWYHVIMYYVLCTVLYCTVL